MPRVDHSIEPINIYPDARLFVSYTGAKDEKQSTRTWYLRVNLRKQQILKTTRVRYDPQDETNETLARRRADKLYLEIKNKDMLELPQKEVTLSNLAKDFLKEAKAGYEANAVGTPVSTIKTSKEVIYWDKKNYQYFKNVIGSYITQLKKDKPSLFFDKPPYNTKDVSTYTDDDMRKWNEWKSDKKQTQGSYGFSPSTLAKHRTILRHIFKYGVGKSSLNSVNQIPFVPVPSQQLKKRRRREIKANEWDLLTIFAREKYGAAQTLWQKYNVQFYWFIHFLDLSGVRPFTTIKHAPKWDDIDENALAEGKVLISRTEKGKHYTATGDPYLANILRRIKLFQEREGIVSKYLFTHPQNGYPKPHTKKGDPIGNFRKQWETAMEHFEWNEKGVEQSERLSPYSIRHRYAGRRLHINKDITLFDLASIMGTSVRVLTEIYAHFDVEREYDSLMKGTLNAEMRVDVYKVGHTVPAFSPMRNSEEHKEAYSNPDYEVEAPDG